MIIQNGNSFWVSWTPCFNPLQNHASYFECIKCIIHKHTQTHLFNHSLDHSLTHLHTLNKHTDIKSSLFAIIVHSNGLHWFDNPSQGKFHFESKNEAQNRLFWQEKTCLNVQLSVKFASKKCGVPNLCSHSWKLFIMPSSRTTKQWNRTFFQKKKWEKWQQFQTIVSTRKSKVGEDSHKKQQND